MKTIEINDTITDLRYIKFVVDYIARYQRDPSTHDAWQAALSDKPAPVSTTVSAEDRKLGSYWKRKRRKNESRSSR